MLLKGPGQDCRRNRQAMPFRPDCSAPLESSHLSDFVRPEIARAPIAQCLVWALFVVPADPRGQLTPRVVEAGEVVLPDTFFLQAAEEALDDAVLLWRVGRDELLGEPVVATRCPKPPALVDQAVVRADDGGGPGGPQRPEAF